MAVTCPIDFDVAGLRAEVQTMYSRVATSPDGEFHFHRGPHYAATRLGYDATELAALPAEVTSSFAGIGNPHAIGRVPAGATVLDIGCGAGTDLLLAARQVGPTGRAIGVDMTEAMRERASKGAAACGLANVDVRNGDATRLPVEDRSVDVVISNGVLNLVPEKERAVAEIGRALKPGGRVQIADIIIGEVLPDSALRDIDLWTGWIAGALLEAELIDVFTSAGFADVAITNRFDCFAGTTKERTARRYGVVGVNVSATRHEWGQRDADPCDQPPPRSPWARVSGSDRRHTTDVERDGSRRSPRSGHGLLSRSTDDSSSDERAGLSLRACRRGSTGVPLHHRKDCLIHKEEPMAQILAVGLHASDDPTLATLPFITAVGAIGADKACTIALVGEAASLAREAVAKGIHGVGFPPLPELIAKVVQGNVRVFVWGACSVARGVTEADLKSLNATFMDPIKFANLIAESNVVTF